MNRPSANLARAATTATAIIEDTYANAAENREWLALHDGL
jgi:hypothetical protein